MKKHCIAFLLILSLMITACTPKPSAVLDDTSCEAPCWRNISMGMKKDDVISLLSKMSDINQKTIKISDTTKNYWNEGVEWNFIDRQESDGGIYFHDGKVVMLDFEENGVLLSEAIRIFGEPNQVWATKMTLDTTVLDIIFMYPKKGICYENLPSWPLFSSSINSYRISGSLDIRDIFYFDPSVSMDKYDIDCIWQIDKSLIQPWKGYGNYTVYQDK